MEQNEINAADSDTYRHDQRPSASWVKVTAIAAASAVAGGLAAAWYYRKTLNDLRVAEECSRVPDFGISEEHVDLDT